MTNKKYINRVKKFMALYRDAKNRKGMPLSDEEKEEFNKRNSHILKDGS